MLEQGTKHIENFAMRSDVCLERQQTAGEKGDCCMWQPPGIIKRRLFSAPDHRAVSDSATCLETPAAVFGYKLQPGDALCPDQDTSTIPHA